MIHDEGKLLQDAMENMPCELKCASYNDAISLQARLNRYIRSLKDAYRDRINPYESVEIMLIKPKTLRFELHEEHKLTSVKT